MKIFLLILAVVLALPALAIDFVSVQQLLKEKGTSLEAQAQKGNKAILCEIHPGFQGRRHPHKRGGHPEEGNRRD